MRAALGLATPHDTAQSGEPPQRRIERAMYELACGVNLLRNKQGTGHGRPWVPTASKADARAAIEAMGLVGDSFWRAFRRTRQSMCGVG